MSYLLCLVNHTFLTTSYISNHITMALSISCCWSVLFNMYFSNHKYGEREGGRGLHTPPFNLNRLFTFERGVENTLINIAILAIYCVIKCQKGSIENARYSYSYMLIWLTVILECAFPLEWAPSCTKWHPQWIRERQEQDDVPIEKHILIIRCNMQGVKINYAHPKHI